MHYKYKTEKVERAMKKTMLLVSMALGLVAFALPAGAMALTIKDSGAELTDKTVSFTGEVEFNTLGASIKCNSKSEVTVNKGEVKVTNFEVVGALTACVYGGIYEQCVLKAAPTVDNFPIPVDLSIDNPGTMSEQDTATLTGGPRTGTHATITGELQTKSGSTSNCNVTTNDLTLMHDTGVGGAAITVDIETTAGHKISGLKLTGTTRVDRGAAGEGTTTPSSTMNTLVNVAGTQTIEAAGANTYEIA
jgi:hypothetical protein